MKTEFLAALVLLAALCAAGQGTTLLYDQQSSTLEGNYGNGVGPVFQNLLPTTGQAFTPALSAIDFIKLEINDASATNTLGSTWFLNLRSTSITGPILGTTASVALPGGSSGAASFLFPNTIALTPGTQYFFDVNTPDGGTWHVLFSGYNYLGGNGWSTGHESGGDYWFREGIIVPEPSSAALLVVGGGGVWLVRRRMR
jgi:hypothetical protein